MPLTKGLKTSRRILHTPYWKETMYLVLSMVVEGSPFSTNHSTVCFGPTIRRKVIIYTNPRRHNFKHRLRWLISLQFLQSNTKTTWFLLQDSLLIPFAIELKHKQFFNKLICLQSPTRTPNILHRVRKCMAH